MVSKSRIGAVLPLWGRKWVQAALMSTFLFGISPADQKEWSQWRGAGRDGSVSANLKAVDWSEPPLLLWEREVGGGYAGPVAAEDRVWVHSRRGGQESVSCLSLQEGEVLWSARYDAPFQQDPDAFAHGLGPFSTPCIAEGRLFTVGVTSVLSVWSAQSGDLLWRRDYSEEFDPGVPYFGMSASPLVWKDLCLVHFGGHARRKAKAPGQGALVALSVLDGREQWRWEGDAPALGASPVIGLIGGQPQLITKTMEKIVGLDPRTGSELWQIPFKVPMDNTIVTPLLVRDLLVTSDYQMGLRAWRIESKAGIGGVYELWNNPRVSLFTSSPVTAEGQLVGFSHYRKGELFGLDLTDGTLLWRGEARWGEHASLVSRGNELLVFLEDGRFVFGKVSRRGFRALRTSWLGRSGLMWGHPAVIEDRIIVRDGSRLAVYRMGRKAVP